MINLLYCGNLQVFDGIMLSLLSAASKSSVPVFAHIATMDLRHLSNDYAPLTDRHIQILDTAAKRYNPQNSVRLLDATEVFLSSLGQSENLITDYTPYCLLRLLACRLDLPDRLLYLDADTMLCGDVAQFLDYDLQGCEMGVVVDHLGKRFIAKDYINTGVLYLNLDKIRQTGLFDRALELCQTKKMIFPDQDALNELLEHKLYLPRRFNEQQKLRKDTVVQHFSKTIRFFPLLKVINIKQWQINSVHKLLKIRVYDDVYDDFLRLRQELGNDVLAPFVMDTPPPFFRRLKYTFAQLKSYLTQNGGVFRRKKREECERYEEYGYERYRYEEYDDCEEREECEQCE